MAKQLIPPITIFNCIYGSVAASLVYGVSILVRRFYLWYTSPLRGVPGPPPLSFFFGYMLVILREPFMDPHKRWWNEYRKKHHGKSPPFFAYSNIFGSYSLCILDPDIVKNILTEPTSRDPVRFSKNYFFLKETIGSGLVTLEGSAWSRHRRLIQPSFQNISFLKEALNKSVSKRIERLVFAWCKVSGSNRSIDVASHMSAIILDVMGDVAFSHDFGATNLLDNWAEDIVTDTDELKITMDPLIQAMQASMKLTFTVLFLSALNMSWLEKFVSRKFARTRTLLNNAVDNVIREARDNSRFSKNCNVKENNFQAKSLLQLLFEASEITSSDQIPSSNSSGRTKLSDIELRDETKTFIIAGHETTSTWCYWAMYALAKYPEVQRKVYSNIEQHSTSSIETPLTIDEADSMEYLSAFLNEVLRLYSPVGLIFRYTTREERWHEYLIPKKTRCILPIHLLNRHPDYWSNPEAFVPDRWLNKEECTSRHKFCFIPFSAGGRNCVGQRFAEIEAKLIVANICRRFQINLAPCMHNKEITFTNFVSMKSKPPVVIQVQKR